MRDTWREVILISCRLVRDAAADSGDLAVSREINPRVGRLIHGSEDEAVIRETEPETRPRLGRASSGCVRMREGSVGLDKVDNH